MIVIKLADTTTQPPAMPLFIVHDDDDNDEFDVIIWVYTGNVILTYDPAISLLIVTNHRL